MKNYMNNIKISIQKDGQMSIECDQMTALSIINSMINKKEIASSISRTGGGTGVFTKAPAKTMTKSKRRTYSHAPWTDEQIKFVVDNISARAIWKNPLLRTHTKKAIEAFKSRIRRHNFSSFGQNTTNSVNRFIKPTNDKRITAILKSKAPQQAVPGVTTDYLSSYTNEV